MIRVPQSGAYLLAAVVCLGEIGCQLRRPKTAPSRMIEPQLVEPQASGLSPQVASGSSPQVMKDPNAAPIRLLDTQTLGHIGRRLLHQQPNGELVEDAVWRWAAPPDRYLDAALRMEAAAQPRLRLVDSASATSLSATLLAWNLESEGGTRLVAAVEFQVTGSDRVQHTRMVRLSEPISETLPGDLSAASGRLLHRLALEGLRLTEKEQLQGE